VQTSHFSSGRPDSESAASAASPFYQHPHFGLSAVNFAVQFIGSIVACEERRAVDGFDLLRRAVVALSASPSWRNAGARRGEAFLQVPAIIALVCDAPGPSFRQSAAPSADFTPPSIGDDGDGRRSPDRARCAAVRRSWSRRSSELPPNTGQA
jgi:hypothetical protein